MAAFGYLSDLICENKACAAFLKVNKVLRARFLYDRMIGLKASFEF